MLQPNRFANRNQLMTRRDWLTRCGGGLGLVGLAALMAVAHQAGLLQNAEML